MLKIKKKKVRSIEHRNARNGFYFILPWIIGITLFFISPLVQSILFSFCDVNLGDFGGLEFKFIGIDNFKRIFLINGGYTKNLTATLTYFVYSLPIIVILSLIFAIVLNQNFRGRLFARSLFFLPVIIASGVVMVLLFSSGYGEPVSMSLGSSTSYSSEMIDFNSVLGQMGFSNEIIDFFSIYISKIFTLIWSIGVQIILFISGLQTIPAQLYEVSKVEGATKWEEFWYITIPMLGNIIFLVIVYTVVELCLSQDNKLVNIAYNLMKVQNYGESSAMLWVYFLVTFGFVGIILLIYNKFCLKKWR